MLEVSHQRIARRQQRRQQGREHGDPDEKEAETEGRVPGKSDADQREMPGGKTSRGGCAGGSAAPIPRPGNGVRYAERTITGKRMPIAGPFTLVLSGGGLKGLAHIGVFRALEARGLRPSLVVGSSMGSLVAAAWATGMSLDEMTRHGLEVRRRDIFQVAHVDMALKRMRSPAVYRREPLDHLIHSLVGQITFDELVHPLLVNTVELNSGMQVLWGLPGLTRRPGGRCGLRLLRPSRHPASPRDQRPLLRGRRRDGESPRRHRRRAEPGTDHRGRRRVHHGAAGRGPGTGLRGDLHPGPRDRDADDGADPAGGVGRAAAGPDPPAGRARVDVRL